MTMIVIMIMMMGMLTTMTILFPYLFPLDTIHLRRYDIKHVF